MPTADDGLYAHHVSADAASHQSTQAVARRPALAPALSYSSPVSSSHLIYQDMSIVATIYTQSILRAKALIAYMLVDNQPGLNGTSPHPSVSHPSNELWRIYSRYCITYCGP